MRARIGDELIVKGVHLDDPDRRGVIIEVHGVNGAPPYLVRWSDSRQSSFSPTSDAVVVHPCLPVQAPWA